MPARRPPPRLLVAAVLVVAVVAAFWSVLGSDFVDFDDDKYVTANPYVQRGLDLEALRWAWATGERANYWHPLTWMSHMLDWQLYGPAPAGHHATSLGLHAVNTVLVFLLFERTTSALWRSALVAALFGLHPLHVESVAWISERKDVLSTCLWLSTLLAYVRYARTPSVGRYAVVALGFVLALASKPMAVTLPFTLLLLDYWPLGRLGGGRTLWRLIAEKFPLLPLAAACAAFTILAQGRAGAVVPLEQSSLALRVGSALVFYVRYLEKTLWPAGLSFFYRYPVDGPPPWQIVGSGLLVAALTAAAVRARRPPVLVGWLWYLGTLVPVIGLVQVGAHVFADRYSYVPLIGVFVAVAWLLPTGLAARPVAAAAIVVLVALGVRTWVQVGHWRDSEALFTHGLGVDPQNPIAHANLAIRLTARGEVGEAIGHLQQALSVWPGYVPARVALGNALLESGRPAEAIPEFEAALEADPTSLYALTNLGFAHARTGRPAEAIAYYEHALALDPDFAPAHRNLGAVLLRAGKIDEAIAHFEQAVAGDPRDAATEVTLGSLLAQTGRPDEGLRHLARAIELRPDYQEAHVDRIQLLVRAGRYADAWEAVRLARAAGIDPGAALLRQLGEGMPPPPT